VTASRSNKAGRDKDQVQTSLGFETRNKKYRVGTKFLLDDSIYDSPSYVPAEVKGMLFEYEVVKVEDGMRNCQAKFNDLVIKRGGNRFRTFKVSSCFLPLCSNQTNSNPFLLLSTSNVPGGQ
jgi:hypothetical protein